MTGLFEIYAQCLKLTLYCGVLFLLVTVPSNAISMNVNDAFGSVVYNMNTPHDFTDPMIESDGGTCPGSEKSMQKQSGNIESTGTK